MNYDGYISMAFDLYEQIVEIAVPIGFVFGMGNLIVNTFLRVAFGGRLRYGTGDTK